MEENREEILETESQGYKPRPKWQIVCAWIGVAIMVIGFALYCWHIATGGML